MFMVLTDRRMTADEFLSLPLDERHTQLIDGDIVVTVARLRHQRIAFEIARLMTNWLVDHPRIGEALIGCNFRIDDYNVFVPDVWFVRHERVAAGDPLFIDGLPDLAVEVRSPSTWRYDIGRKKDLYVAGGLSELWLVDTAADEVLVYRGDEALELGPGDQLTTPHIAGLSIDLTQLFDR